MKRIIATAIAGLFGASAFSQVLVDIPLDQQINIGQGDAIYSQTADATLTFVSEDGVGFARSLINNPTWFYSPRIDLVKAGIGGIDISDPETVLSIDLRVFQGGGNTNPYGDANAFLRVYTMSGVEIMGWRDFGIIYGPNMTEDPNKYPAWQTKLIYLNDSTKNAYTDTNYDGLFNAANVHHIRFYGTDWAGTGEDFLDAKNLKVEVVPEPAALTVLGLGALALVRRRKKA